MITSFFQNRQKTALGPYPRQVCCQTSPQSGKAQYHRTAPPLSRHLAQKLESWPWHSPAAESGLAGTKAGHRFDGQDLRVPRFSRIVRCGSHVFYRWRGGICLKAVFKGQHDGRNQQIRTKAEDPKQDLTLRNSTVPYPSPWGSPNPDARRPAGSHIALWVSW